MFSTSASTALQNNNKTISAHGQVNTEPDNSCMQTICRVKKMSFPTPLSFLAFSMDSCDNFHESENVHEITILQLYQDTTVQAQSYNSCIICMHISYTNVLTIIGQK